MSCQSSGGALANPEMAHTLAASAATLAAVASPHEYTSGLARPAAVGFDDEEFPYPTGLLNGVKCCTKCGAIKTPQWREGPYGAKTLCNACGVKRTRKLRAEQEGAKRRKLSAAPLPPPAAKHHAAYSGSGKYPGRAAAAAAAAVIESYGCLEPELEAWGLPSALAPAPAGTRARLPRRAAEEAAFRTARYARTGEWAGEGGEGGELDDAPLRAATPSSSDGYSLPSSSCPEEVSWPPAAGGADCHAAVNLMTMSAKQVALPRLGAAAPPAPRAAGAGAAASGAASPCSASLSLGGSQPLPPLEPEQYNHDSLLALAAKYDGPTLHHHKVVPVDMDQLSACLPPAKVLELVRLNQALELAVHEAHAANAAVAAVAQVLASKQAAGLRAREVAGAATKRLRRFMSELDTQFGIQSKFSGSRQAPLSPAKPAGLASPTVLPSAAPLSPVAPPLATMPSLPAVL
ncbi:hypothetical protein ABPG75_009582 [Micractinium tetrahymenae]